MANLNPSTFLGSVQWKLAKPIKNSYFYSMFHSCLGFSIQKSPKGVERKMHLSSIAAHSVIIPFGFQNKINIYNVYQLFSTKLFDNL